MRYKFLYTRAQVVLIVIVVGLAVATISRISSTGNASATVQQPEVLRLETRVNQMEQRLYMMETTLRNFDSRVSNMSARGANPDLAALRSELYVLQQRLVEQECALAKLDERTLSPELRAARKRSGAANNPCRTTFDTPLRLPTDR